MQNNIMQRIIRIAIVTGLTLLVPLVAMQFTEEVNWTLSDFVIMGVLLFVTGLVIDMIMRKMGKHRVVGIIVVVAAFLYIWAELAVGIFTNWGS